MRKSKLLILITVAITVITIATASLTMTAFASNDLDYIKSYNITVKMREDATMDIRYDLVWQVLDSDSEGPLNWVIVGIPNENVDEIKILSDSIKNARYYSDDGDFVRLDLRENAYAGQTVNLSFSIHQSRMFTYDPEESTLSFSFTPGWFYDIKIEELNIYWYNNNVISQDADESDIRKGIYKWNARNLSYGDKVHANVTYSSESFTFDPEMGVEDDSDEGLIIVLIIFAIIIGLIIFFCYIGRGDGYNSHRGFGCGYRSTPAFRRIYISRHTPVNTSSSSHSSCACACACACAGGGRAGCSKKETYSVKIKFSNK